MVKCNSCDYIGKPSRMQGSCFVCGSTDIQAQTEQEKKDHKKEQEKYKLALEMKRLQLQKILQDAKQQRDKNRLLIKKMKLRNKVRRRFLSQQ